MPAGIDNTTEELLRTVVVDWRTDQAIESISAITPDASMRRFYRIRLPQGSWDHDSLVAMVFDSTAAAEVSDDGPVVKSDDAYVELTSIFRAADIAVPELYFDARGRSVLLLEDLGELMLIHTIVGSRARLFPPDDVEELYRRAIDVMLKLQQIPSRKDCFAFQRRFNADLYRSEVDEFCEYLFFPLRPNDEHQKALEQGLATLIEELERAPVVLAHRDFHSWNLVVDTKHQIRVIDFQDALLAPQTYDLASLLNDRDTDNVLGAARYGSLLEYFLSKVENPEAARREFYLTSLQRGLKVAGRFRKLAKVRGLSAYEEWVPGALFRIGETLRQLSLLSDTTSSTFAEMRLVLDDLFSEVSALRE